MAVKRKRRIHRDEGAASKRGPGQGLRRGNRRASAKLRKRYCVLYRRRFLSAGKWVKERKKAQIQAASRG